MKKELTFEQANKKLEDIVLKMEKGDIELDECMKLYEEACLLVNYCKKKLEESKGQIIDINERVEKAKKNNDSIESLFED